MRTSKPSSFAANLRCPDDGTVLRVTTVDVGMFGVCRRCDGIWMARRLLEDLHPVTLPVETRLARHVRHKAQPRHCSACATAMRVEKVDSVTLDVCPKCGGVWMDPGEHHFARKFGARSRRDKTAPPGLRPKTGAGRLLSDLVDVIAEALAVAYRVPEEPEVIPRVRRPRKPSR